MKQTTSKLSHFMLTGLITLFGFSVSAQAGPLQDELNHVTPPPEIEWQVSPFGSEMWSLQGDFLTGAHVTYIKFPAGTLTPLHIHSADYLGIVVAGTTRHTIQGELESSKILPPGSHWYIPANAQHVSECLSGFECIMAITQETSFDFIPRIEEGLGNFRNSEDARNSADTMNLKKPVNQDAHRFIGLLRLAHH